MQRRDYKPAERVGTTGENIFGITVKTTFSVWAFCLDPDKYGAGNPDGQDVRFEDLDWIQVTWEYIRGGKDSDSAMPPEDHLLAYDTGTGFWHPITKADRSGIALDYDLRYSDIDIQTSLEVGYEEDDA